MKTIIVILLIFISLFGCNRKTETTRYNSPEVIPNKMEIIDTVQSSPEVLLEKEEITDNKNIFETQIDNKNQMNGTSFNRDFLRSNFLTLNFYNEAEYEIKKWYLNFLRDFYEFKPPIEGDPPVIRGTYEIIDNKVILKYKDEPYGYEFDDYKFDDILREDWELEYIFIDNSLHFFDGLTGKGIIFGRIDSEPREGDVRIINGHEIIMQRDDIRANSNVTVRIGPGINYQHFVFEWWDEYDSFENGEYVFKKENFITEYFREGYTVYILGHSKNIDTINELTGYWYYCKFLGFKDSRFKIIEPANIINNNGWIFGPLLGLK